MALVIEPTRGPLDDTMSSVREFVVLTEQIRSLSTRRDELKATLSEVVERQGESDGNGHQYLPLPAEVGGVTGFQRQRRVTRALDEEAARSILSQRGILDRCTKQVEILDQDEVMAAVAEGILSGDDVDLMFPPKVSYAFVPVK